MVASSDKNVALLHEIAERLGAGGQIEIGTMFRSPGLRTGTKIFAFLGRADRLIVKLPRERVIALVEGGGAEPVTMGSRTMREWVAIDPDADPQSTLETWTAMAREALLFVRESDENH